MRVFVQFLQDALDDAQLMLVFVQILQEALDDP
jgi:hypothetical protein